MHGATWTRAWIGAVLLTMSVGGAARSEERRQASEAGETGEAGSGGVVTREYVDRRIEDFERSPESRFLVSGYGTAQYVNVEREPDGFRVQFNPGFHFRMSETLHFNGELEIGLEHGEEEGIDTDIELEFAQIDYLANDWLVVSGGKLLVPFNAFSQRLHPTWINKMASTPPIYGGHGDVGIIPILSDLGAVASGGAPLWSDDSKINYALYVVHGPETPEHEEGEEEEHEESPIGLDFDGSLNDDDNLAVGGRIGFLPVPNLEIGLSYQTGELSGPHGHFHLAGADGWYAYRGLELRAEYVLLSQDAADTNPTVQGYYGQASYRLDHLFTERSGWRGGLARLEPVVRWGQIYDLMGLNRKQLAVGLDFWLFETAPLKITYEVNSGAVKSDRFFVQFAYGF